MSFSVTPGVNQGANQEETMIRFFSALPLHTKESLFTHLPEEQKSALQRIDGTFFTNHIDTLPNEIVHHILSFLPMDTLFRCRGVCKKIFDSPVVFPAIKHFASSVVIGLMQQKGNDEDDLTTKVKTAARVLALCPFFSDEAEREDGNIEKFLFRLEHPTQFPNIHAISLLCEGYYSGLGDHLAKFRSLRTLHLARLEDVSSEVFNNYAPYLPTTIEKLLIPEFKISAEKIAHLVNLKVLLCLSMNVEEDSFYKLPKGLIHLVQSDAEESNLWYDTIDPKKFHLTKIKTLELNEFGEREDVYSLSQLKELGWTESMIQAVSKQYVFDENYWYQDIPEEVDLFSDVVEDTAIMHYQKTQDLSEIFYSTERLRAAALENYLKMKRDYAHEDNKKLTKINVSKIDISNELCEEIKQHKEKLEHIELEKCFIYNSFFQNIPHLKIVTLNSCYGSIEINNLSLKVKNVSKLVLRDCGDILLDLQEAVQLEELECPQEIAAAVIMPPSLKKLIVNDITKETIYMAAVNAFYNVNDSNIEEVEVAVELDLLSDDEST